MDQMAIVHRMRLESDYRSLQQLTGSVIVWQPISPCNPTQRVYPDKYHVTFNILAPTSVGNARQHRLEIDCSTIDYPRRAPIVRFLTPPVTHPNVYDHGGVCIGGFPLEESLAELCIRLARFLQFDPTVMNLNNAASARSRSWYLSNRSRLPMDRTPLPSFQESGHFRLKGRHPGTSTEPETSGNFNVRRRTPGTTSQ